MPTYTYDGLNKQGQNVHGEVIANDSRAAMERLREAGVIVTTIQEKDAKKEKGGPSKKVSIGDLSIFCRQFAAMTSAGVPVTRSLTTLSKQTVNKSLAAAVKTVAEDVESGSSLADAFARHPKIFNPLFIAMIRSGELGGILEQSLISLSSQLQKEKKLKDNIKSATSYPRNIGIFALVLLLAMLWFMVPIFKGMMAEGTELNGVTQFIFNASDSLRSHWYIWILVVVILVFIIRTVIKSKPAHIFWENHKLTLPKFGDFMTKMVVARFCRTLATLLAGGVPAVQALDSAGATAGADLIDKAVKGAIVEIEDGKSISDSLDKCGLFPPMLIGMISIGEESGTLPDLLDKVAEFFEEDVEVASQNLRALIEPIALIGVGGIVGGMLVALYIPMFTAATSMEGY